MEEPFMTSAPLQTLSSKGQIQKIIAVAIAVLLLIGGFLYFQSNAKHLIDTVQSPNGAYKLLVYDCDLSKPGCNSEKNIISFEVYKNNHKGSTNIFHGVNQYMGSSWADDNKFIICTKGESCNFEVVNLEKGSGRSVSSVIDSAFYNAAQNNPGCGFQLNSSVKGNYQFERWSQDGNYILFTFNVIDTKGLQRKGYFWYSYLMDSISGIQLM